MTGMRRGRAVRGERDWSRSWTGLGTLGRGGLRLRGPPPPRLPRPSFGPPLPPRPHLSARSPQLLFKDILTLEREAQRGTGPSGAGPATSHLRCRFFRLPGHRGRPYLWPLLLPPWTEPALPAHDAYPDRRPGLHDRSHLSGSGCVHSEISTLSRWPRLESFTEMVYTAFRNHQSYH